MDHVALAIWLEAMYIQTESDQYFDREDWIGLWGNPEARFYDADGAFLPHL